MRVVACLTSVFFAPSLALFPVKFSAEDCGGGALKSSDVVPSKPQTGEVFTVTHHFTVDRDVSEVHVDVKVKALGFLQLTHQTFSHCGTDTSYDVYLFLVKVASVTVYGAKCPIAKGPMSVKYDVKLLSILPPVLGTSSFHLTAKDQTGADLFCVQAQLGIVAMDTPNEDSKALALGSHSNNAKIATQSPSLGLPVKFKAEDCGPATLQSSDVVPTQPRTGEVFTVAHVFAFDEDVSGGHVNVKVTALGGIPLKHETFPLCGEDTSYDVYLALVKVASVTFYGSKCPMPKGPAMIKYDVKLLSILPPALGNAAFHFTATDQNGRQIVCVQAQLGIQLEDGIEKPVSNQPAQITV